MAGAPANFAYHAQALGAEAFVWSRVGDDALGREILDRFSGLGLRQHFWSREIILQSLELANVLKFNGEELPVVATLFELSGDEAAQMKQLATRFELGAVALTKGANGSALLVGSELVSRPCSKLVLADTVGAGDSYTAALAMGLLAKQEPEMILETAHRLADYVCTQPGAMPPILPDFLTAEGRYGGSVSPVMHPPGSSSGARVSSQPPGPTSRRPRQALMAQPPPQ